MMVCVTGFVASVHEQADVADVLTLKTVVVNTYLDSNVYLALDL